jgi:hypothetical protein
MDQLVGPANFLIFVIYGEVNCRATTGRPQRLGGQKLELEQPHGHTHFRYG